MAERTANRPTGPITGPLAMPASAVSPPARRVRQSSWLDQRLIIGIVLVLVSVLLGARVVSAADSSVQVWAVSQDLAAGTTLAADDLRPVRVRLVTDADRYVRASAPLAGRTLTRPVGAGELLPRAALTSSPVGRLISLPVPPLHAPDSLRRGQLIDVFATSKSTTGNARSTTVRVLSGVAVQAVRPPRSGLAGSSADYAVLVRVPSDSVTRIVAAIRTAEIDVVVVTGPASAPGAVPPPDPEPTQQTESTQQPSASPAPSPS